ncbi:uncharacterized protein LOC110247076 [Exaiptasia diaphana]|uniref:Uncharacterized protein n=1 Tax=Exaiptasia diaphana TaxID=2652724 RepID=A0A913XRJ5_EXADI|nr:uncharacterized protein LOC110247076 [Exaiptasia diaphana]
MGELIAPGHAKSAGIVGILILIVAFIDFICGIVWVTYGGSDAQGIWCGLLLIVTGILGVVTWPKKNKVTMIFFMVLCIIDIICCIVQTALAGLAFLVWQILKAIIETKCKIRGGHCDCGNEKIPMELEDCSWISAIEAIFLCLMIINGLGTIFVFAGSIIGCVATCCASSPQQSGVVMVQNPNTAGTVVIHTTAQPATYPAQTVTYPAQPVTYPAHAAPPPAYSQEANPPGQYPMADPIPPKVD